MPGEEHDRWLSVLGVDAEQVRTSIKSSDSIGGLLEDVRDGTNRVVDAMVDTAKKAYGAVEGEVTKVVEGAKAVESAAAGAVRKALASGSGGGAPSGPMAADCKPIRGYVPGPAEHLLCMTHGHILNIQTGLIIAASLAEYKSLGAAAADRIAAAPSLAEQTASLGSAIVEVVTDAAGALAGSDDASPNQEKQDGGTEGGTDAGTQPDPDFDDNDKPFNVRADDPVDFVNRANEYLGEGIAGHMTTDPLSVANLDADAKGNVTRANLRVRTTTVRPRWIAGRPIGDEKAVIEQAQELIRQHEERHREIMKEGMRSAVKEMRGKPKGAADKILQKWIRNVDQRQNELDSREGQIQIIQSEGRMTGARLVPR